MRTRVAQHHRTVSVHFILDNQHKRSLWNKAPVPASPSLWTGQTSKSYKKALQSCEENLNLKSQECHLGACRTFFFILFVVHFSLKVSQVILVYLCISRREICEKLLQETRCQSCMSIACCRMDCSFNICNQILDFRWKRYMCLWIGLNAKHISPSLEIRYTVTVLHC